MLKFALPRPRSPADSRRVPFLRQAVGLKLVGLIETNCRTEKNREAGY
jgi:hypothetical protein